MIKESIQEEDITIINIYAPNIAAPQYIRQLLTALKEEIDSNAIIVGDFNTSLTPMDRSSKQKITKARFVCLHGQHYNGKGGNNLFMMCTVYF